MTEYSFWKGLWKAILPTVIVGLPLLLKVLPDQVLNLTVSGVILLAINWLKVKYGLKIS